MGAGPISACGDGLSMGAQIPAPQGRRVVSPAQIDAAVGRMAGHSSRAADIIMRTAEEAESESVRLRAAGRFSNT